MKKHHLSALLNCAFLVVVIILSGKSFMAMHEQPPIYPGPGVTEIRMLSEYYPDLKNTAGDTEVYVLQGKNPGGSMLVLGGTHANEPAGYIAGVVMIENLQLEEGTLFVIPQANRSAFTHSDPQEGAPQEFTIETAGGVRWFRYGSRATNPVDQWPDPDVYIHQSGQKLSGSETRNLNRAYPGRSDSTLTEKVAYGIMQLIREEEIDVSIDLHEASPEYPVINAIVAHERANELAAMSMMYLQFEDLNYALELSPTNFHGLSHREWGDYSNTNAILMETANPIQGRLRGKTTTEMIMTGKDACYVEAARLNRLYVDFDENGHPLEERVGRHIAGIRSIAETFAELNPERGMQLEGLPSVENLQAQGIGTYLHSPEL